MSEQEVVADAQPTEEAQNTEASVERPEWLPEKFKSPEDQSTAYSSLESKLGQKDEEIRATVEKEMQDKFYAERPAEKGDYILPEGIDEVMTTRRLSHIVQTFSIFGKRDKAIALCVNRFDDDTRAAFIDLYEKVDATVNAPSDEELTEEELLLRSSMITDEDN